MFPFFYPALLILPFAALYFYTKAASSIPRLYAKAGNFRDLLERLPSLQKKFEPPWLCPWGIFQTVYRQLAKDAPSLPWKREILSLEDGGQVGLDWLDPTRPKSDSPIIIILPGLTGSSFESYVVHLVSALRKCEDYRMVVFNNRGNGGVALLTPKTYSAAYIGDLQQVVVHVNRQFPDAPKIAIGFSLGGMILFNYLSRVSAEEAGLKAALCISSSWVPVESTKALESFWPRVVFNKRLAQSLCAKVASNREALEEQFDVEWVLSSGLIREFDERLIVPMFGYADVEEYYEDAAFPPRLHRVSVPVLLLNAADDCFSPIECIPLEEVCRSDRVGVVVTSQGGHIAFMTSLRPSSAGFLEELASEFARNVFDNLHGCD